MQTLLLAACFLSSAALAYAPSNEGPSHDWTQLGVETEVDLRPAQPLYNFTPDGDEGVWLQDFRKRWYYATVAGVCPNLGRAVGLGYDTRSSNRFDKSAKLVVKGFQCGLSSLVTANRPPSKKEIKARVKARATEKRALAAEARASKSRDN